MECLIDCKVYIQQQVKQPFKTTASKVTIASVLLALAVGIMRKFAHMISKLLWTFLLKVLFIYCATTS